MEFTHVKRPQAKAVNSDEGDERDSSKNKTLIFFDHMSPIFYPLYPLYP